MTYLRILFLFIFPALAYSSACYQVQNYAEASLKASELAKEHGAENVLFVTDCDNTLLITPQKLGGAAWMAWQFDLLKEEPTKTTLIGNTREEVLDISFRILGLSKMHLLEERIPSLVSDLQNEGIATLVLTARSPELFNTTERQLAENSFDFSQKGIPPFGCSGCFYFEKRANARLVFYHNSIFFVAGSDKGKALLNLFERCKKSYPYIVFIDDEDRNVQSIYRALKEKHHVYSYHYQTKRNHLELSEKEKEHTHKEYEELKGTLDKFFKV